MSQPIPTAQIPFYTLRTRLDGSDFTLEFKYSPRASRFYMNLYDASDTLLIAGLKMVTGIPLLHYYHHLVGVPAGELMVVAYGTSDESPSLLELGVGLRCTLTYFTADEVEASKATAAGS